MYKSIYFTLSLFLFSGCVSPKTRVSVDRTVYHSLLGTAELVGKSFVVEYLDKPQGESLELTTHTAILTGYFKGYGMKQLSNPDEQKSDYVIRVHYFINGQNKVASVSSPKFVTTGGTANYSNTTYGAGGTSTSYGTVNTPTTIQYAGQNTSSYTYTEYTRAFFLTVHSREKLNRGDNIPIYEGRAVSEGTSKDTTKLFPILISSLMYDFPSKSGVMDNDLEFEME